MNLPDFISSGSSSPIADFRITVSDDTLHLVKASIKGELSFSSLKAGGIEWKTSFSQVISKKPLRCLDVKGQYLFVCNLAGEIQIFKGEATYLKPKRLRDPDGAPLEITAFTLLNSPEELDASDPDFLAAIGDDFGNVYIIKLVGGRGEEEGKCSWNILETFQEQDDAITAIVHHAYRKAIVASSGDGTLLAVDLKTLKIIAHSSSLEDEIPSMILDEDSNILCGTGLGALVKYKWGYWGKVNHRLKPAFHARSSITAISAIGNNLVTGTEDGTLRAVSHNGGFAVEHAITQVDDAVEKVQAFEFNGKSWVACSSTNDSKLVFFEISPVTKDSKKDSDSSSEDEDERPTKKKKKPIKHEPAARQLEVFFSGLD